MSGTYRCLVAAGIWMAVCPVQGQQAEMMPLEKMGPEINTDAFDEGSPVLSLDGKTLYFTRAGSPDFVRTLIYNGRDVSQVYSETEYKDFLGSIFSQISDEYIPEPYASSFNQDIWVVTLAGDTVQSVAHPPFPLNNALPNSVVSARLDTNTIAVINQFYRDGSMYEGFSLIDRLPDGTYTFPRPLHIYDFYNMSSEVSLTMSGRGHVIILSLRRRDSHGQNDLYASFKFREDLWSAPVNLGPVINTGFQETTPFIASDNRKMYFASNRPGGYGGLDIYVTERLDYTWLNWTEPRLLAPPVNSEWDDSQPFHDEQNNYFYFASRRDGTSDIFRLPLWPKPKLQSPLDINGLIVDAETMEPIRGEVFYGPHEVQGYLDYFHTYTGDFSCTLTEYGVYKFLARKPGYSDAQIRFDTRLAEQTGRTEHEVILYMYRDDTQPVAVTNVSATQYVPPPPVTTYEPPKSTVAPAPEESADSTEAPPEIGQKITFHNIYFERSKANILSTSQKALDELFRMLDRHPYVNIRIEGHTDNVGNELDLMKLSWERAEAIKTHLANRGIDPGRIAATGMGHLRPVTDNRSESSREKNRRVEVYVVE